MPINWPSSFDLDSKVIESATYTKDGGGLHPSNKIFNPKPVTVMSGKDAVLYRTSASFATDLEAGQTAGLETEGDKGGGVRTLLAKLKELFLRHARRVGRLTCPGCAFSAE